MRLQKPPKGDLKITSQLLTFSRKKEPQLKPLNLNELIKQSVHFLKNTLGPEYEFQLSLDSGISIINADPTQVQQILMNLCINSKDAMPGGGRIEIRTFMDEVDNSTNAKYMSAKPGTYVTMQITDNGSGMVKEVLEHIFEPFYTTKEVGRGTGLGMSIIYGIMKSHKGFINVYSEKGIGTTMKLYFPASGSLEEKNNLLEESLPEGTETVLIVDDEETILNLAQSILGDYGYKCILALDGKSGLEIYKKDNANIDLVILDVVMPGINGIETYKEMKKINSNLRALISSGFNLEDNANLIELGVDGLVSKPYSSKELTITVRKVLDADKES